MPEVRLVDENGEQAGVVATPDALSRAEAVELDLVEVAPTSKPPVCKLMDYSKFRYERIKKAKEAKKKQKVIQNKEVRFRPKIQDHDIETKLSKVREFLDDGDRVKITIMFRGREMAYLDQGPILMDKIMKMLGEDAQMEYKPTMEGRFMTTVVTLKSGGN